MKSPKVFGIGFHKTATTSLAAALGKLGYRVTGPNWVDEPDIEDHVVDYARRTVRRYDAFQDNPWPLLFKQLDEWCPGSKFILTIRDTDDWIKSVVKHFGKNETPMRRWIYGFGSPVGNEEIYIERYERHNADVREYFSDRSDDFLVLNITNGDGWEKLCPFLNTEVPELPFPHKNRSSRRKWTTWKQELKRSLKAAVRFE